MQNYFSPADHFSLTDWLMAEFTLLFCLHGEVITNSAFTGADQGVEDCGPPS